MVEADAKSVSVRVQRFGAFTTLDPEVHLILPEGETRTVSVSSRDTAVSCELSTGCPFGSGPGKRRLQNFSVPEVDRMNIHKDARNVIMLIDSPPH